MRVNIEFALSDDEYQALCYRAKRPLTEAQVIDAIKCALWEHFDTVVMDWEAVKSEGGN